MPVGRALSPRGAGSRPAFPNGLHLLFDACLLCRGEGRRSMGREPRQEQGDQDHAEPDRKTNTNGMRQFRCQYAGGPRFQPRWHAALPLVLVTCAIAVAMQWHVADHHRAVATGLVCRLTAELTYRRQNRCPPPVLCSTAIRGPGQAKQHIPQQRPARNIWQPPVPAAP